MAFHLFRRLVFPDDLLVPGHYLRAIDVGEEDIAIRQQPALLRVFGVDLPFERAIGGDVTHVPAVVIAVEKARAGKGGGNERERGKDGKEEKFHGRRGDWEKWEAGSCGANRWSRPV